MYFYFLYHQSNVQLCCFFVGFYLMHFVEIFSGDLELSLGIFVLNRTLDFLLRYFAKFQTENLSHVLYTSQEFQFLLYYDQFLIFYLYAKNFLQFLIDVLVSVPTNSKNIYFVLQELPSVQYLMTFLYTNYYSI